MSDKVDFRSVGEIAQTMKFQARIGAGWADLPAAAQEAIDQILSSIARTVSSGQGVHWDGIMAYADSAKVEPEKPLGSIERVSTEELERSIRKMAREIPARNGTP